MSDSSIAYSQQIPDNKLQARIFTNYSPEDAIFIGVCLCLGYLAGVTIPLFTIVVAITSVILFVRLPRSYGRLYREVWLEMKGSYIEGVLNGILWQEDESSREKRFAKYLRGRRSAIPLDLTQISAVIDGKLERFGLLRQRDRPYDHLIIKASGGNFANMDNSAESRGVNTLAAVTNASILQNTDMKVGLSYVHITTPYNPYQVASNLRGKIDPIIQFPEKFALSEGERKYVEWQRKNMDQWRPTIATRGGTESWQLIVVTIKRPRSMRIRSKARNVTNQQLMNLPIIELGRTLVQDLSNATSLGLKDVHCCGLAEVAEVYRVSWDAFGTDAYFRDKSMGLIPTNDDDIDRFMEAHKGDPNLSKLLDGFLQAFPKRIVKIHRKKKCVQFDENFIPVIRITQFPKSITPDRFRELLYRLSQYGWIRRSMVAESVSSDKETRQQLIGQSAMINIEQAMNGSKIVRDPRIARRRREREEQTNVISSQSIAQLFNYLWPVVCPDLDSADRATREVIGLLRGFGFNAKVVSQPALYVDAAISGLIGANRL